MHDLGAGAHRERIVDDAGTGAGAPDTACGAEHENQPMAHASAQYRDWSDHLQLLTAAVTLNWSCTLFVAWS